MNLTQADRLERIGLSWRPSGQASLRGPLLRLADNCDRAFLRLAALWDADEERHPASLPADRLQRVDYLRSFPHQATFPVRLDPNEENLVRFAAGEVIDGQGDIALTETLPVDQVLTPAACYHIYSDHAGEALARPMYLTTRNTCFRQETRYEPLRRQWSFTMREIVCVGGRAEVADFLKRTRAAVDGLLDQVRLPVVWRDATDPFFRPRHNPKYLLQRVQPSKQEATYGGELAIGSVNLHHDHFGDAFAITRDGAPAHSGCVAFGIERWLYAITETHGPDPAGWPDLELP